MSARRQPDLNAPTDLLFEQLREYDVRISLVADTVVVEIRLPNDRRLTRGAGATLRAALIDTLLSVRDVAGGAL